MQDDSERGVFLRAALPDLNNKEIDALAEGLKEKVIEFQRADIQRALRTANLILEMAELTANLFHRALGLRAKAQALVIGQGEYNQALPLYDEALSIHESRGDEVGEALVQGTRIWALAALGRYEEAIAAAKWASTVMKNHEKWRELAIIHNNLAMIYRRIGDYDSALELLNFAKSTYLELGDQGERLLANNELNRAYVLYLLGELEASTKASQNALEMAEKFNQTAVVARAQHNQGITYFRLGQANKALALFEKARESHLAIDQTHEAALCELSSIECLLELGRFNDVLERGEQIYATFIDLGMRLEAAETLYYQAISNMKLSRHSIALEHLEKSRNLFSAEGNKHWIALTELQSASLHLLLNQFSQSLSMAQNCIDLFTQLDLPVETAQAQLLAGRAAVSLERFDLAKDLVHNALAIAKPKDLPGLTYQSYQLLGKLSEIHGDRATALENYETAIQELERLRSNVMVEFQADFLEDKQKVYEQAVNLLVEGDEWPRAFEYVERAKSRALLSILAFRQDLGVRARKPDEEPLVKNINSLRSKRENLLIRGSKLLTAELELHQDERLNLQQEVQRIEKKITELWHKLLIRNADYARDASLWNVIVEPVEPHLDDDVMLVEYFVIDGRFILFEINSNHQGAKESINGHRLEANIHQIDEMLKKLFINFKMVPFSSGENITRLIRNAKKILHRLYQMLFRPLDPLASSFKRLIIVPHGPLHYIPFHALYDGKSYLGEKYQISYLPAASFLRFSQAGRSTGDNTLIVGHSFSKNNLNAVSEAIMLSEMVGSTPLLEEEATLEKVQMVAPKCRLLHFACHGEFRADNPLFSGLALADGWLTTLDIFNLDLQASLVTLSACQTGRALIGGGDELSGLMRAFLAAGTASLVLSQWVVDDRSALALMSSFYKQLVEGDSKAAALQAAQCGLLEGGHNEVSSESRNTGQKYSHPYYWAPFFLVGDAGTL